MTSFSFRTHISFYGLFCPRCITCFNFVVVVGGGGGGDVSVVVFVFVFVFSCEYIRSIVSPSPFLEVGRLVIIGPM